jgi:hypothetical protein
MDVDEEADWIQAEEEEAATGLAQEEEEAAASRNLMMKSETESVWTFFLLKYTYFFV